MTLISLGTWLVATLTWVALLGIERAGGCPGLTDPSLFADEQSWQWLPPGQKCVYRVGGGEHVDAPPTARLAMIILLLVWPTSTIVMARAASADRRSLLAHDPV